MKFKQIFIFLFTVFFFFSCSSFKDVPGRKKVKFDTYGYEVLNGKYELYFGEELKPSLNKGLFLKTELDEIEENRSSNYIEIQVLNEKRIEARLYIEDKIVEKRRLKGKFKDNYFVLKKRREFKLAYVLLNLYGTEKNRLFLNPDGDLVVDSESGGCGLFVFFPVFCAGSEKYDRIYARIKDDLE